MSPAPVRMPDRVFTAESTDLVHIVWTFPDGTTYVGEYQLPPKAVREARAHPFAPRVQGQEGV